MLILLFVSQTAGFQNVGILCFGYELIILLFSSCVMLVFFWYLFLASVG